MPKTLSPQLLDKLNEVGSLLVQALWNVTVGELFRRIEQFANGWNEDTFRKNERIAIAKDRL